MRYHAPYGSTDANAGYVDKDTPSAVRGSVPPAAAIETPQREIVDVIAAAGFTPSDGLQLGSAVQSGQLNCATAGGSSDIITASFTPAVSILKNGMRLLVRAASANATTAPTFTPNFGVIAASPIKKGNGLLLALGDIAGAGYWMELAYDFSLSAWILLNPATGVTPQQLQSISASVASNALTVNYAGGNLSFRSSSLTNGIPVSVSVPPLSLTIPTGATLGMSSGVSSQLVLVVFYNGGTPALGIIHAKTTGSINLNETQLLSSTLISTSSNNPNTLYSNPAVSGSVYRVVGYLQIAETAPGTWASGPTLVQPAGPLSSLNLLSTSLGYSWATGTNGYQVLPTGTIRQWGTVINTGSQTAGAGTFPIAFPNACNAISASRIATNAAVYSISFNFGSTGFGWYDSGSSFPSFTWIAEGN